MEKIEVGEYVKTEDGKIRKIKKFYIDNVTVAHGMQQTYYYCGFYDGSFISSESYFSLQEKLNNIIVKHSKNIIDLIEVGDIIDWRTEDNSYYGINEVINRFGTIGVYAEEYDACIPLNEIIIKKILTHEKYEKECYRIGE